MSKYFQAEQSEELQRVAIIGAGPDRHLMGKISNWLEYIPSVEVRSYLTESFGKDEDELSHGLAHWLFWADIVIYVKPRIIRTWVKAELHRAIASSHCRLIVIEAKAIEITESMPLHLIVEISKYSDSRLNEEVFAPHFLQDESSWANFCFNEILRLQRSEIVIELRWASIAPNINSILHNQLAVESEIRFALRVEENIQLNESSLLPFSQSMVYQILKFGDARQRRRAHFLLRKFGFDGTTIILLEAFCHRNKVARPIKLESPDGIREEFGDLLLKGESYGDKIKYFQEFVSE